jgi:hypothetical protein
LTDEAKGPRLKPASLQGQLFSSLKGCCSFRPALARRINPGPAARGLVHAAAFGAGTGLVFAEQEGEEHEEDGDVG